MRYGIIVVHLFVVPRAYRLLFGWFTPLIFQDIVTQVSDLAVFGGGSNSLGIHGYECDF